MKRKLVQIGVLSVLALTLAACGQGTFPSLGGEEAVQRSGGGIVPPSGQFTEGVVATATGTVSAEPETAEVTFGVQLQGDDPAALVDEAADKMDDAVAAAREAGVAEEDVETVTYNLRVETVRDRETGELTGEIVYHISHQVQVTLNDLERVGDLLAAVVEAGANTISNINFTVEDPQAMVEQARQQALETAAQRAQQMAEGLEVELGPPILIQEIGGSYPLEAPQVVGRGGAEELAAAPSISPGAFSVSVSIQVVYEIR